MYIWYGKHTYTYKALHTTPHLIPETSIPFEPIKITSSTSTRHAHCRYCVTLSPPVGDGRNHRQGMMNVRGGVVLSMLKCPRPSAEVLVLWTEHCSSMKYFTLKNKIVKRTKTLEILVITVRYVFSSLYNFKSRRILPLFILIQFHTPVLPTLVHDQNVNYIQMCKLLVSRSQFEVYCRRIANNGLGIIREAQSRTYFDVIIFV